MYESGPPLPLSSPPGRAQRVTPNPYENESVVAASAARAQSNTYINQFVNLSVAPPLPPRGDKAFRMPRGENVRGRRSRRDSTSELSLSASRLSIGGPSPMARRELSASPPITVAFPVPALPVTAQPRARNFPPLNFDLNIPEESAFPAEPSLFNQYPDLDNDMCENDVFSTALTRRF